MNFSYRLVKIRVQFCFPSEFTDLLNSIQGCFRTPSIESLSTLILIKERDTKGETQA